MVFLASLVLRPRRALHQALGIFGLTFGLTAASAVTTPAIAAPAAAHTTAAAAHTASQANTKKAKTAKAKKKASAKATKRAGKGSSRTARRTRRAASRSATRTTRRRAERRSWSAPRPAPQPSADLVMVPAVELPDLALAATPGTAANGGNPFTLITRSATSLLDGLVARARSQLGTRYVYGGADPDNALDCSSFARYVMESLGARLPRTANEQARVGTAVPRDLTALRPGDLLTFGTPRRTSHVGIYLGSGRFIHASVKSGQVIETTIERNRSLFRRWQGARRLLAGATDSVTAAPDGPSGAGG